MTHPTSPSIPPALTAEEWDECLNGTDGVNEHGFPIWFEYAYGANLRESQHALAALALHDQPFGFHHGDVIALRHWAEQFDMDPTKRGVGEFFRDLADRIASLLPPKDGAA